MKGYLFQFTPRKYTNCLNKQPMTNVIEKMCAFILHLLSLPQIIRNGNHHY
jgi:hypothetical protein